MQIVCICNTVDSACWCESEFACPHWDDCLAKTSDPNKPTWKEHFRHRGRRERQYTVLFTRTTKATRLVSQSNSSLNVGLIYTLLNPLYALQNIIQYKS
jgi:hypothetical protein